ncbi:hypothetical protein Chor_016419 [Crotalus horridus]
MAYSTLRKVALASCLVLCISLLLPKFFRSRGWRQPEPSTVTPSTATPEGKSSSYFPPTARPQMSPEVRPPASQFPRSHLAEAIAKAKGGGGGGGGGSGTGRGLVGQVIPIYGFGILLYILYILFKLQDKLRETEQAMEKIINRVGPNCERSPNVTNDQEKKLLQHLREITKVMKEGKLIDSISPEKEAEEAPYMQDWEGYPEETFPVYDNFDCFKHRQDTILVDFPDPSQPSAEEIAERMEFLDNEDCLYSETLLSALAIVNNGSAAGSEKKQTTFGAQSGTGHNFEECYCGHYEEDDPAVLAENAGFFSDSCSETEEVVKGELPVDCDYGNIVSTEQKDENPDEIGILRKRNTKVTELLGH